MCAAAAAGEREQTRPLTCLFCRFSLNSDDPAYFGGYLLDNYIAVQEAFGFTKDVWRKIVADSYDEAWTNAVRKEELRRLLDNVMDKYKELEL